MAKKTIVTVVDDVDGAELGEDFQTVKFSIGSTDYEFDTSPENAEKFYNTLDEYVKVSRKLARNGKPYRRTNLGRSKTELQAIRKWAQENGYTVSDRGRIPQEVQDAYNAAR